MPHMFQAETQKQRSMGKFVEIVLLGMKNMNELRKDAHDELRDLLCKAINMGSCSAAYVLVGAVPKLVDSRVTETAASTGDADMLFSIIDINYLKNDDMKLHIGIDYQKLMLLYLDAIEPIVAAGTPVPSSNMRWLQEDRDFIKQYPYPQTPWQQKISNVLQKLQRCMPKMELEGAGGNDNSLRDIMVKCMRLGACGAVVTIIRKSHKLVTPEVLELAARLGNVEIMRVFIDHMQSKNWEFDETIEDDLQTSSFTYLSLLRVYFDRITEF